MKPGDPVIVEGTGVGIRRGTLIRADVWEGDEQWTYVKLEGDDHGTSHEPWRVKPAPEAAS